MPHNPQSARARGAALLTLSGIASAFGAAACCALPILLTTAGLSAAWLGSVAAVTAPYRDMLLWVSLLSLLGGTAVLWRMQRAATHSAKGCTPPALRLFLLVGLICGATLLWLGYSYA